MKYGLILLLVFIALNAFSQEKSQPQTGEVTFITSKNVYVKFANTSVIQLGDQLPLSGSQNPCLLVTNKSSTSVVCTRIGDCKVSKGDKVVHTPKVEIPVPEPEEKKEAVAETKEAQPGPEPAKPEEKKPERKQKVRGRISATSYNNIASDRENRYRLMSRFTMNVDNINDSRFSAETYMNYRHILPTASGRSSYDNSIFRIYNLAVRYEAAPGIDVVLGRKINYKMSSVGAIDGLQVEKSLGKNYVGIIGGFRPDFFDFGFNSHLLQYGGYIGRTVNQKNMYSQTTLGMIEQRNTGNIDRRYTYFQHSGTIGRKLRLFSSLELDLYSMMNGVVTNEARLTNLYASASYRFGRKLNVMLSYDSRNRIIYYETFLTEIERMLNDDIARQGIRVRVNLRPVNHVITGFSFSQRFQSDNQNKSDNLYVFANVTKLPLIGGRLAVNYNINRSNYLMSNIASIRHSRSLIDRKLDADLYYRYVSYSYFEGSSALAQHYIGSNLSYNIGRKLLFSFSGEMSTFNGEQNYRIYTGVTRRFYNKK